MRKLLLVAIVCGIAVAGDAFLRATAESRVATQLDRSLGRDGSTSVSLGGFPFVVRLVSGTIPTARIETGSLVRDRLRLTDLEMTLQDLSFSLPRVAAGDMSSIHVGRGRGRAFVPLASLKQAVRSAPAGFDIRLGGRGLRVSIGPVSGRGRIYLAGTDLVVAVDATDQTFKVPLPTFLRGVTYEAVRVEDAQLVVEFSFTDASLERI